MREEDIEGLMDDVERQFKLTCINSEIKRDQDYLKEMVGLKVQVEEELDTTIAAIKENVVLKLSLMTQEEKDAEMQELLSKWAEGANITYDPK